MKILLIRVYPGKVDLDGYNHQEIGLARALVKKGHECGIVYYTEKDSYNQLLEKNITIHWIKGGIYFSDYVKFNINEIVKISNKYDLIQLSEYNQLFTYLFQKVVKSNRIIIYHGPYKSDLIRRKVKIQNILFDLFFLNYYRKNQPRILCKSIIAEKELNKKGLNNTVMIGVGLDPKWEFCKKENRSYKILYIGSVNIRRDLLFGLKVFKELTDRGFDYKFVVVGKGDKDYVDKCKNYIQNHGMSNLIEWNEYVKQDNLGEIYKDADLFIFPTKYEIFGMVMLEAMYFGLPVVTTYNGGSSSLIENGVNGFIIDRFSINDWADVIAGVLMNDSYYRKVSDNAHETIVSKFTWDKISEKYLINTHISN